MPGCRHPLVSLPYTVDQEPSIHRHIAVADWRSIGHRGIDHKAAFPIFAGRAACVVVWMWPVSVGQEPGKELIQPVVTREVQVYCTSLYHNWLDTAHGLPQSGKKIVQPWQAGTIPKEISRAFSNP